MSRTYPYETPEMRAKIRAMAVEISEVAVDPKERDLAAVFVEWLDDGGPDGWIVVDDEKLLIWTRILERVRRARAASEASKDAPEKAG